MDNDNEQNTLQYISQLLIAYTHGEQLTEIMAYLTDSSKEYIPSLVYELDGIINNADTDATHKIEAFNTLLNEYTNKLNGDAFLEKKFLYCVSYLYIYLYKQIFVQIYQSSEDDINDNSKQIIELLYNTIVFPKHASTSTIHMLIEILRQYTIIIDRPLTYENSQELRSILYLPADSDAIPIIDNEYLLGKINLLVHLVHWQSKLFKTEITELHLPLREIREKIIRHLDQNFDSNNCECLNHLIIIYISYKAKYIMENDLLTNEDETLEPLQVAALALEKKLNTIFNLYLSFCNIFKQRDIYNQNQTIKLMSIYNKIAYIADNPIILKTMRIQKLRQQLIDDTINWILATDFDSEKGLVLINKIRLISAWQQLLDSSELNYVLKFMEEWQADYQLSGSNLKAVLNCKLALEMHYVDTLDFDHLMDYYDFISAETEKPPMHSRAILSKDFTSAARNQHSNITLVMPEPGKITIEDKNRRLVFEHDSKLRIYAARALDRLNPNWYRTDANFPDIKETHPSPRAKSHAPVVNTTVQFITYLHKKSNSRSPSGSVNSLEELDFICEEDEEDEEEYLLRHRPDSPNIFKH